MKPRWTKCKNHTVLVYENPYGFENKTYTYMHFCLAVDNLLSVF